MASGHILRLYFTNIFAALAPMLGSEGDDSIVALAPMLAAGVAQI